MEIKKVFFFLKKKEKKKAIHSQVGVCGQGFWDTGPLPKTVTTTSLMFFSLASLPAKLIQPYHTIKTQDH